MKAGVAETGVNQTRSPHLDMEEEGRTEDIYSLPTDSTNSLESRPATRRKGLYAPRRLSHFPPRREQLDCPSPRASREHIPIVRPRRARRMVWRLPSPSQAGSLPLSPHSTDGITSYTQQRRPSRSSTARVEGNSSSDPITCYEKRIPTHFDDSILPVSNHHVSR